MANVYTPELVAMLDEVIELPNGHAYKNFDVENPYAEVTDIWCDELDENGDYFRGFCATFYGVSPMRTAVRSTEDTIRPVLYKSFPAAVRRHFERIALQLAEGRASE